MASKRNRLGEPSGSMTFGEKVLKFNQWLKDSPPETSDNIEVLQPFENVEVQRVNQIFYNKYFGDDEDAQMAAYMIELTDKFGDEILDAWPNMTKEARRMKIDCL